MKGAAPGTILYVALKAGIGVVMYRKVPHLFTKNGTHVVKLTCDRTADNLYILR